jgi:hypothetical protein
MGNSQKNELVAIQQALNSLSYKLESINNTLTKMQANLTDEIRTTQYTEYSNHIVQLEEIYKSFLKTMNNITKTEFKQACVRHAMLDTINWIHDQLTGAGVQTILPVMKRDNDRRKFFKWSQLLIAKYLRAVFLYESCLGVTYSDSSRQTLIDTLKARSEEFRIKLEAIKNKIKYEDEKIEKDFFQQTIEDTKQYMVNHPDMSNEDFSREWTKALESKYYWRNWYVASYNGDTTGYDQHAVIFKTRNAEFWKRQYKRNLFVTSPEIPTQEWENKAEQCIEKISNKFSPNAQVSMNFTARGPDYCLDIINHISGCVVDYGSVLAIKWGHGLRSSATRGVVFKNVHICTHSAGVRNICLDSPEYSVIVTK